MKKKKETKEKRRKGKGWSDHTRLGTDCAQTKCLTPVMSRKTMEHQSLHQNSKVATHIKTDQSSKQLIKHAGTFLTTMEIVRNERCSPHRVHKKNANQGSLELVKALNPNRKEMCICKFDALVNDLTKIWLYECKDHQGERTKARPIK